MKIIASLLLGILLCLAAIPSLAESDPCIEEDTTIKYYSYSSALKVDYNKNKSYNLWRNRDYVPYALGKTSIPTITAYLTKSDAPTGCEIVFPGGGYAMRSNTEAQIAQVIQQEWGLSAFVVNYRIAPNHYRAILSDALRAIRFVRYYADDFNVEPSRIAVLGFSAGGHLALMTAEHFDDEKSGDMIDSVSSRPDLAILCYPVSSMQDGLTHEESRANFLGDEDDPENRLKFSGETAVREDMPPVFLSHAMDDGTVPIEGSYALQAALERVGIPITVHWYEVGDHGYFVESAGHDAATWQEDIHSWLLTMWK